MCVSILLRPLKHECLERFFLVPYSRYVSQSASCEAFGQNALKVCRPLNGKQEQLHLNLLSPRSHHFSKLHP